ncbi:sulfotransferase family 2 domain-containing protein [Hansschlegelia quercus]|uniref:Sulfotransferase family protein n=1 Tax=Hansschlegelia quercus TaxID=2528245 RepID=A0A4V2JE36_9HYPH|nr:sulfotransferase family 2 domain-containing protein [Hansschlegelia quercus]TBN53686.1 hypothetical protein EYR15_07730 [Hansschlegelia quercus]
MIFSVHIPKTAGTSFRNALKERYGDRLALYYGPNDPATHPLLKVSRRALADQVPALESAGIEVLHGHYTLDTVKDAVDDPSRQVITWLRDPIDRLVSHYSFIKERPTKWAFDKEIKSGALPLVSFARKRRIRNMATRYLGGYALEDLAFVGVTERFELGLAMLFGEEAPVLSRRYNAVSELVDVSPRTRQKLYALNIADIRLYGEACRLMMDRVAASKAVIMPPRPEIAGTGVVRRLIRRAQI